MFPLSAPVQTLHTQLSLQTKEQFEPLKSLQMMFQKKKKKSIGFNKYTHWIDVIAVSFISSSLFFTFTFFMSTINTVKAPEHLYTKYTLQT